MPTLTYGNYVYGFSVPNAPYVGINIYTETLEDFTTAVTGAKAVYLAAATVYADEYEAILENKEYVLGRFAKDALINIGLATVVKNTNTYTANVKANEYYVESVRGLTLNSEGVLSTAYANLERLYQNLFLGEGINEGEPLTTETEEPITYDDNSIVHNTNIFIPDVPRVVGTSRTFTSYGVLETEEYALKYDTEESVWFIYAYGDAEFTKLYTCPDIDAVSPEWTEVTESSESSV